MQGNHSAVRTLPSNPAKGGFGAVRYNRKLRQHQNVATFFMAAVYIPYMLLLGFSYDIFEHSLSRIGWRYDGFSFLLAYVLLSVPFMLYQILVNIKFRDERNRVVNTAAIVGLVLLIGGALVPFRETDSDFVLNLHRFCGAAGSILLIFLITYLLVRCFMLHQHQPKKFLIASVIYGIFLITFTTLYFTVGTIAIFEVGSTFGFFMVIQLLNRSLPPKQIMLVADEAGQRQPQRLLKTA